MNEYLKATGSAFLRYRHLLGNLVRRDISIKYRRSALGWLWSILNPLLMMTVMVFVFQNLFTNMAEMDKVQVVSVTGEP
ncbi:MAG: ABC transporter permease, partial [Oscillospiraceae bacterium]